jgi:hypothetical protein
LRVGTVHLKEASRDHQKAEHGQSGTSQAKPAEQGESEAMGMANQEIADNQKEREKQENLRAHGGAFRFGPKTVRFELRADCFGMMTE